MRFFALILSVITIFGVSAREVVTLMERTADDPVVGATVISANGVIIGITDSEGAVDVDPANDFPLSIRCLGYEPLTLDAYADTVRLDEASVELPGVTVNPADRPVTRMVSFVREYTTAAFGPDTIQMLSEYMVVSYGVEGKVKGFKKSDERGKTLAVRRYARFADGEGLDSVARPKSTDDAALLSWVESIVSMGVPSVEEPKRIKAGEPTDTLMGKFWPRATVRKSDGFFSRKDDLLADQQDHRLSPGILKLLGLTLDFNELTLTQLFRNNGTGSYGADDLVSGSFTMRTVWRGKMFRKFMHTKEPIDSYSYIEYYPVDITHLTVEQYQQQRKDKEALDFSYPSQVQPLPPALSQLKERVEKELPLGADD